MTSPKLFIVALALACFTGLAEPASPSLARESRLFELRTYYAAPGKLEALHARFRDHTNKLFVKHGMELVGYWVPKNKDGQYENKLVYIISHADKAAADKSWAAFKADPDWKAAQSASEKDGKILEKVESFFMTATDYSPIK